MFPQIREVIHGQSPRQHRTADNSTRSVTVHSADEEEGPQYISSADTRLRLSRSRIPLLQGFDKANSDYGRGFNLNGTIENTRPQHLLSD